MNPDISYSEQQTPSRFRLKTMNFFLENFPSKGVLLLFTFCFSGLLSAQSTKSALFIGNSYTGVNNLPMMVSQAATSTGDVLIYDSHTPGGARLMNHAVNATAMSKIAQRAWDFVTIQAQSQEPSWDSVQMNLEVFPFAKKLCDTIRHFNACTQPLFYTTWGRQNGDAGNCAFVSWVCTYQGMDSALTSTYTKMARDNKTENSPVGPVWRYLRDNHPGINLYASDGSHPSVAGSYAAACTFYALIFKKDPNLITWNSSLAPATAAIIRQAAKTIAFDHLSDFDFSEINPVSTFTYVVNGTQVSFTPDSPFLDSVRWDFGDRTSSNQMNPVHSYALNSNYTVSLTAFNCGRTEQNTLLVNVGATSLEEVPSNSSLFSLSPNPASNQLNLALDRPYEKMEYRIYSSSGKLLEQKSKSWIMCTSISVGHFPSGVYILHLQTDNGIIWIRKFLKE